MTDLLIDTHVFLWWQGDSARLGATALDAIGSPGNRVFVSAASIWEIAIKARKGRLAFSGPLAPTIARSGFFELPMTALDAEAAGRLDWDHPDPFDRVLVAQAIRHELVLITADRTIRQHGAVPQLWAGA